MNEVLSIVGTAPPRLRWLILRFDSIEDVDYVAAKMLVELADRIGREQVTLVFRLERLLPVTGLESAGFDSCAISSFASRPGKKPQSPKSLLGCCPIGQHGRPIGFIPSEHGPGHAG